MRKIAVVGAVGLVAVLLGATFERSGSGRVEQDSAAVEAVADLDRGNVAAARRELAWLSVRGPGWGLSYAWDAFGDGTVNPRSTVYAYTTALAGLAFADAYARLHDQRYLNEALRAADLLASPSLCCWRDGAGAGVWYSNRAADHLAGYRVYNVSGLTLALLSRTRTHRRLAIELKHGLLAARTDDGWRYMSGSPRPNDLVHATFIVVGLYAAGAKAVARAEMNRLWDQHLPGGKPDDDTVTWGSHGWGPAAALWALAETGECGRAAELEPNAETTDPRGAPLYAMARAAVAAECS